ncbi:GNAT family N-acetyltransferase [Moritella sp. F3]|uniref:GNAT family N-acetyltransferase n=1 Tax=Moritella sp. F3 TaxID=2718882 RepID=UPI0018E0FEFD|nr:GNAT family N-acetyltransferase [Moritella sp. F3]GIC75977.1 N-acetyltransferase GCN5 [Moritella sp. F1]GIC81516.1 N-acetyltransferase GCN5 [Moritella sp. F3]
MIIRPVRMSDAHALSILFTQLNTETPFMAMGEQNSAAELCEHLALFINSPTQVLYVIEAENQPLLGFAIGIAAYISGDRHSVSLVIGIEQASIGRGLGRQLLLQVEAWARLHQLQQLELTVMVNNINAIKFYENTGFKQQTIKPSGMVDDLASNELYMRKAVK